MNELRPTKLKEVIGQNKTKKILQICIESSIIKNERLPHILFEGPPGIGKSTFGYILSREIGSYCTNINAATISDQSSLIKALGKAKDKDIIFIDEIHALPPKCAELLYMPLEDQKLIIESINKYTKEKHVATIPLQNFTLIGATTNIGKIPKPLFNRMRSLSLDFYEDSEISEIIKLNCDKLKFKLSNACAKNIAKRCKGTPRIANAYLEWIRDFCLAGKISLVTEETVDKAFALYGIDDEGLDKNDKIYIETLEKMDQPLGLKAIASMSGLSEITIEEYIEPFLLRKDVILKTKTGRILKSKYHGSFWENL